MADIRIAQLPTGTPTQSKLLPMDLSITEKATVKDIVYAGRPAASQEEAEAGTDADKVMTPLTVKQSIASEVGESLQAHSSNLDELAGADPGPAGLDILSQMTLEDARDTLDLSGKYNTSAPYVSQMARFRQVGISPEDVDSTNEIGNDADAAIPIREMFGQGIDDGIISFNFASGRTYNLNSWDPNDPGHSMAVFLNGISSDIIMNVHGATLKGLPGIQESTDNAGTMFRIVGDGVSNRQRLVVNGGEWDMTELASASSGVTTVGGMSLGGRLSIELRNVLFNHGIGTPSGDFIGTGGGDQSVFCTNYESLLVDGCQFIGAPDLGIYLSNSGGQEARIVNNRFYRCQNGIAQKRFSKRSIIANNRFTECDTGVYNPVADGLTDNQGGALYVFNNVFEKIQTNPVEIGGPRAHGSKVQNNVFLGWGRRISDGGEVSASGQRYAIRIRVPNCIVSGNIFDLDGFTGAWTSGKEQIGIEFNYSGGDVDTPALDCISYGNVFKDMYRAHVMGASTARIRRFGNKRVNVQLSDLDNGDNILPVRMTDDTLVTIIPPQSRSLLGVKSTTTGSGWPNGTLYLNTTGGPSAPIYLPITGSSAGVILTTGITTVGGATDGSFTFSAGVGTLTMVNRTGQTVLMDMTWDQE